MRIALLISGGGTTASAIITACKTGELQHIQPALIIADRAGIAGIARTIDAGMDARDVITIEPKTYASAKDFGRAILQACAERSVEFVGQYGWLTLTPANVIERFAGMMTNQHPGPLDIGRPDFGGAGMYGRRVHAARICFVQKTNRNFWSEATAQRVGILFDEGAVLKTKQVPILPDDTAETLAARMLPVEHAVQIEVLKDFANHNVSEIKRETSLILPGEESLLAECKKQATIMYPNG